MKLKKGFIKKHIGNKAYLIPYGQRIHEDFCPIELNEMGSIIVGMLMTEISKADLIEKFCCEVEAVSTEEKKTATEDACEFIKYLAENRYLDLDELSCYRDFSVGKKEMPGHISVVQSLFIAGVAIDICSDDTNLIIDNYEQFFRRIKRAADITIYYEAEDPLHPVGDSLVLSTGDLDIYENNNSYTLCIKTLEWVKQVDLSKDGRVAKIYYYKVGNIEELKEELFSAVKTIFFYVLEKMDRYAIHSSSILYRDKVFLFTGPTGTGKSTHANLWNKIYGCSILNGDVNVLEIIGEEKRVVVHGTPWCGTSGIYDPEERELGGIVRLYQAKENQASLCEKSRGGLIVYQRIIAPIWTENMVENAVDFAEKISQVIPVFELHCNTENIAVETIRQLIDNNVFV